MKTPEDKKLYTCVVCKTKKRISETITCMDSRSRPKYTCSKKCMIDFYNKGDS